MKKKKNKNKTKQKTGKFERYFKNSARRKIIALRPKKLDVHQCLQSEWYYVSAGYLKFAKKEKKRVRFRCYVFQYHIFSSLLFFLEKWSVLQASPSSFYVFFFFRLHYKPTSRCPGNEPASPTKKLFSGQNKTRPRERRKSSLFFATESIFRPSDWYSPGRLKKKKARGARWEGERLLLALIGIPSRSLRWWERIIPVAPFSIVTIFRRDLVLIKSPSLAPSLRNMRHDTCNPRLFAIIWTF